MKQFKRITLIAILFCAVPLLPSAAMAQALADKIVVIVNDDVITEGELRQRIKWVKANNNLSLVNDELRQRILKNMVEELVQIQRAEQIGINVNEAEVNGLVQRFLRQRNVSLDQLQQQLQQQGLTIDDFREDLRVQSLLRKLVRSDATRRISVSDDEIDTFAKANNIRPREASYDVSYLVVKAPEGADEAEQEVLYQQVKQAQSALEKPTFGLLTEELAKSNLVAITEDLGVSSAEKLPGVFSQALAKMSPGKLSEPLKTSSGVYVLRLNGIQGGVAITEKRKAQHILISASSDLEVEQAKQTAERLKDQIAAGAEFGNVAKYYSDDSGSAATGGDLGWVRTGQMVPRFESALFAMQEGQVSGPIVTNFGVHLIKLNEISRAADPEEQTRAIAYNNLMSQKVDQHYPAFLSRLMGRAYIKYF